MADKLENLKNKLFKLNPNYTDHYTVDKLLDYKTAIIETKYGKCKSNVSNLLSGKIPTIQSSLDKDQYFINMFFEKYGDKYDFTNFNYISTHKKSIFTCKKHGDFKMTPANLLQGQNCSKCSRENTTTFNKNYPNGWNTSNWFTKAGASKNYESFKVYILRFWNDTEEFYKIGRTFASLHNRFKAKRKIGYDYEIIDIYPFHQLTLENAENCINLENQLKRENKKFKYIPKNSFDGMQECFSHLNQIDYIENHRSGLVGKILDYVYGK